MQGLRPFADATFVGVDFSSRPTRQKPIVWARGRWREPGSVLTLSGIERHSSPEAFRAALDAPGPWVGGFDLPFGLPRELVEHLGWPTDWLACMQHFSAQARPALRDIFAAFCAARPPGGKFAHRACDRPAGSSPSMKWVNPPVAWMMHAGVPALIAAGLSMPGLHAGDPSRIALEAYPGLLARELIGTTSYKSDDRVRQTPERQAARARIVVGMLAGRHRLGLRIELSPAQQALLTEDASGDSLDAVLCLVQAAWASTQHNWGLPQAMDPLEGWIITAQDPHTA